MAKGVSLWEHPPNGQGLVALLALGILQVLERQGKIRTFTRQDHNSPGYLHAIIEVLRIAFADGNWYVADPDTDTGKMPIEHMLSDAYLTERAKLFDPDHASPIPIHGSPALSSSDTVYFSVSDSQGNGISFINSVCGVFGSSIVPEGCGFVLQNRGTNFVLGPSHHPNVLAPNKRPYHTIIPAMITNTADDSLNAIFGVMGGFMQPQGHVQVLLNLLAFGMDPQIALDAPRVCIIASAADDENQDTTVRLEHGVSLSVAEALRRMGHKVQILEGDERNIFGTGQVIQQNLDPVEGSIVWSAGSDPRNDGAAVAWF